MSDNTKKGCEGCGKVSCYGVCHTPQDSKEIDFSEVEHQVQCNKEVAHENGNLCGCEVAYYGEQARAEERKEIMKWVEKNYSRDTQPLYAHVDTHTHYSPT